MTLLNPPLTSLCQREVKGGFELFYLDAMIYVKINSVVLHFWRYLFCANICKTRRRSQYTILKRLTLNV